MASPDQKRFVAHFDMLGMRSATIRNQEEAWRALCALNAAKKKAGKLGISIPSQNQKIIMIKDRIKAFIFSDTIIIFSLSDEDQDLLAILIFSCELFKNSLSRCVPVRGGIAYGNFFVNFDENLFLGKALVDAYTIGEAAQWCGIIVDEEIYRRRSTIPFSSSDGCPGIIKWKVPTKNGCEENKYAINWPPIYRQNFEKKIESVEELYSPFIRLFGEFKDLSDNIKKKYENTFDFINANYKI